jgi:hypothetical protein
MYFVSGRSLNSPRETEFGARSHCRISISDVSKIAADRPLSKIPQCANDPDQPLGLLQSGRPTNEVAGGVFEYYRRLAAAQAAA